MIANMCLFVKRIETKSAKNIKMFGKTTSNVEKQNLIHYFTTFELCEKVFCSEF